MIMPTRLLCIILLVTTGFTFIRTKENNLDIIKTDSGLISGTINSGGDIHIFKGIPFAAPPIGELRWKAPQPMKAWDGVKKCVTFGPSPMQGTPVPFSMWSEEFLIPKEPISEDCLYLNVWSGAKSSNEKRPVIVWIYGGGFGSGGAGVPIYDGEAMAKKGIVFVSINYRVGIFGFFSYPELTKESGRNASGNYGLMDQLAALQWVQKNIAAFGGDPGNVTIAGQSAGSFSVNDLVASPLGKNLFQKAIGESGASFSNSSTTLQMSEQAGVAMAKSLNASSLSELRNIPADDLFKKAKGQARPIVDGYVLPESITDIFSQGKENKVSLLTGWNENEGILFGALKTAELFKKEINEQYGANAETLLKFYPADNDSIAALSQYKISQDMMFGTQNYTWANFQSDQGSKVFVYRFARKVPGYDQYAKYGAFHTGEVPYAYDNLKFVNRPWAAADHELAKIMSSYWINFASNGNPNGKGLPEWPDYNTKDKKILILDEKIKSEKLPEAVALDLLIVKMNSK
jgi:para-nitrobenzyl esterase